MPKLTTSSATTTFAWTTVPGELPDLDAGVDQVVVAVLEGRGRLRVVRRLRDDDPHLDAAPGGREDPLDHVAVGEVGVHDVEPLVRAPSICSRIACEAATNPPGIDLRKRDRRRPGCGRRGEVRRTRSSGSGPPWPRKLVRNAACAWRTTSPVTRTITSWKPPFSKWSSIPAPPVQATVAVDHVELAVVGAADLVLAPVEVAVVGVEAVAVEREDVVDDDLRTGVGEPGEHLRGLRRTAWSRSRRR